MESGDWIALGALLVATLVFGVTLYQMNMATQNKISENSLKIVGMEKEILEMKRKHEKDIAETKTEMNAVKSDFAAAIQELRKENRQEHEKMFDKLESMAIALTEVAISFKQHEKQTAK